MQTKSFTSTLAALLVVSAVPMMASSGGKPSGSGWDTANKVATVLVLGGAAVKGTHCLYKYWYKGTPTKAKRLKDLEDGQAATAARLNGHDDVLWGTDEAHRPVAKHFKSKAGLVASVGNADGAGKEFSAAYTAAMEGAAAAARDAAAATGPNGLPIAKPANGGGTAAGNGTNK